MIYIYRNALCVCTRISNNKLYSVGLLSNTSGIHFYPVMQERAYLYNVRAGIYIHIICIFMRFFLSFDDFTPEKSMSAGRNGFAGSDWTARSGRAGDVGSSNVPVGYIAIINSLQQYNIIKHCNGKRNKNVYAQIVIIQMTAANPIFMINRLYYLYRRYYTHTHTPHVYTVMESFCLHLLPFYNEAPHSTARFDNCRTNVRRVYLA